MPNEVSWDRIGRVALGVGLIGFGLVAVGGGWGWLWATGVSATGSRARVAASLSPRGVRLCAARR